MATIGQKLTRKEIIEIGRKKRIFKNRIRLVALTNNHCIGCKLHHPDPSFFDFHHIRSNPSNVKVSRLYGYGWETLLKEAKKCVMLCPNCHRITHLRLKNTVRSKRLKNE